MASFKDKLKGRRQSKNVVDNRLAGFAEKQTMHDEAQRQKPKPYSGQVFGPSKAAPSKGLFAPATTKGASKFTKVKGKPSGMTAKGAVVPFGRKKSKLPKAQGQV